MSTRSVQSKTPAERVTSATCGCALHAAGRKAVAVDADVKRQNLNRLRRIEGQVRGLQQMVESDRYCADILVQISSVQEALRSVGRALLRNHLKHCVAHAITQGTDEANATYEELVQLFDKHGR
jgi:CsoR family transcriptional regulator, copper-sensing transcriptional repressor